MKKFATSFFIVLAVLFFNDASAQKETNIWYFGNSAGLDFSSGNPVPLYDGKAYTTEGTAVMSDTAGHLLFYTDGVYVFNANHDTMPNGKGLFGDVSSSTQSALIVPQPGQPGIYYVFTVPANAGQEAGAQSDAVCYSVVDMSLDGGMGDITSQKNVPLMSLSTEKISGIQDNNGDFWVAVHKWGTNEFYVYKLSSSGLGAPVISSVGTAHDIADNRNTNGQMKFSPDGTRIGLGIGFQNIYEIFDFDRGTGAVSNPVTLPSIPGYHSYGFEFSPNGRFVYTTTSNNVTGNYTLDQYDVTVPNPGGSRLTVSTEEGVRALQLANNGKIYVANGFAPKIGVINSPDSLGTAADYMHLSVSVNDSPDIHFLNQAALGLPNFVQSYFDEKPPVGSFASDKKIICPQNCIKFSDASQGIATTVRWFFPGAIVDSSNEFQPLICYDNPGNYDVTLIVTNAQGTDTILKEDYITVLTSLKSSVTAVKNPLCQNTLARLNASGGLGNYQWQSSLTPGNFTDIAGEDSSVYTFIAGETKYYRVNVTGDCPGISDTLRLDVIPAPVAIWNTTMAGQQVTFNSDSSIEAVFYEWDFGDSTTSTDPDPVHTFDTSGVFHVCLSVKNNSNCNYTLCKNILIFSTGTNDITGSENWITYPVPFTDELSLSSLPGNVKQVELFDVLGRKVLTENINYNAESVKLDTKLLADGIYLLRIKVGSAYVVQRVVKQ